MVHKDISVRFKIQGQQFTARGFLEEDESSISFKDVVSRIEFDHTIVEREGWKDIREKMSMLPDELRDYDLATKKPGGGYPPTIYCFRWDGDGWCEVLNQRDMQWDEGTLILCTP